MTVLWYVVRQGRQQGPLTWEKMMQLVDSGSLQADDLVWHAGLSGWTRVDQTPGLLLQRPPAPPHQCDREHPGIPSERQKQGDPFWAGLSKMIGSIGVTPVIRINKAGIVLMLVVILAALVLKLLGYD